MDITVDQPLHEGTTAVIRSTSLSGIANRYISVHPGANSENELEDGATIETVDTTAPVDLDQLFNTLDGPTRKSLQECHPGPGDALHRQQRAGPGRVQVLRPLAPVHPAAAQGADPRPGRLRDFIASGADVFGALAERREDLSALTSNANEALGAIAAENEAFDRSLSALPPFMRQGNTTFVNLRAALDDLDPLVETSKTATKDLPQFLADLRPVAEKAVPIVEDLRTTVDKPGPTNDLVELLNATTRTEKAASTAVPRLIESLDDSQPIIEFARPYTPDILAFIQKFGQAAGYYDANGHYLRILPAASGMFEYETYPGDPAPADDDGDGDLDDLVPIYDDPGAGLDFFFNHPDAFSVDGYERCPGGGTQPAADGSSPFDDDGNLAGDCEMGDVPFGLP